MATATEWLALLGTILVVVAYLPQILHLTGEHCSDGVSLGAWTLWLTADVLILTHAIAMVDVPFLALGSANIGATVLIVVLAWRYRGQKCALHARSPSPVGRGRRGELHRSASGHRATGT